MAARLRGALAAPVAASLVEAAVRAAVLARAFRGAVAAVARSAVAAAAFAASPADGAAGGDAGTFEERCQWVHAMGEAKTARRRRRRLRLAGRRRADGAEAGSGVARDAEPGQGGDARADSLPPRVVPRRRRRRRFRMCLLPSPGARIRAFYVCVH
ncbi:unnamed protein product [Prorocentrum cordatum]|uniref:Uncharacterized protein n=1 Tax=Prorocentrum cordatum TaxID=2364126 RepID=A0ABN9TK66_9DINO|nr:unnamed protein product [Polarella glacialis]